MCLRYMKRGLTAGVILLLLGMFIPLGLAEIYVGEVNSLYNLGDIVNISASLNSNIDTVGFFNAYFVCGLREVEVYKSVIDVGPENEKEILIRTALDNLIIGNLFAEGRGLEPLRAFARRFSRPVP